MREKATKETQKREDIEIIERGEKTSY